MPKNLLMPIVLAALTAASTAGAADTRLPPPMRIDSIDLARHVLVLGDRQIMLAPDVTVYRGKRQMSASSLRRGETIQFSIGRGPGNRPTVTKIWILR